MPETDPLRVALESASGHVDSAKSFLRAPTWLGKANSQTSNALREIDKALAYARQDREALEKVAHNLGVLQAIRERYSDLIDELLDLRERGMEEDAVAGIIERCCGEFPNPEELATLMV